MADKVEIVTEKNLTDKVINLGRESIYMGLGVVSLVQESVEKLVERGMEYRHNLVERGEKMAQENKGKVEELVEMPQDMAKDTYKKANEMFDKYSEQVLTRVHIPTSGNIDAMTKKVSAVDRKLEKMIKETAAAEKI
ncbi:MAG: phasin family protein [Candidatus Promineofilum sp.]|nr:phasin family protein [Promineifilum sp.]